MNGVLRALHSQLLWVKALMMLTVVRRDI